MAEESGLFIIAMSHYPVACNGEHERCVQQNGQLAQYFEAMFNAGVSLYVGAHAHEYNRVYPYYKNNTFSREESPYRDDQGYMISIVEGVGGSNTDMVESVPKVQNITAAYTVNQTGFGLFTINYNSEVAF